MSGQYHGRRRKQQIGPSKVLTHQEQELVVRYLQNDIKHLGECGINAPGLLEFVRLKLIYAIMVCTGLRETELVKLRLRDCGVLMGWDDEQKGIYGIEVHCGKGGKDRTIEISAELKNDIDDYLANYRHKTLPRWKKRDDINEYVFYDNAGHRYFRQIKEKKGKGIKTRDRATTTFYRMIRKLGESAGLTKRLHPHMLRHTFAVNSLMGSEGEIPLDIYHLADLMGHSSIEITALYLRFVNMVRKRLGARLDYVHRYAK